MAPSKWCNVSELDDYNSVAAVLHRCKTDVSVLGAGVWMLSDGSMGGDMAYRSSSKVSFNVYAAKGRGHNSKYCLRFVDASTAVQLVGTGRRTTRMHHLPAPAHRRGQRRRRVARAVVRRAAWAEGAHAQRGAQDTIMLTQLQQLQQNERERGARVKQVPRGKGPPEPQVAAGAGRC